MSNRLEFAKSRLHMPLRDTSITLWKRNWMINVQRLQLGENVSIFENVQVGFDCEFKSGSVIGESGFGYERDENGTPINIHHSGGVIIGNNVCIGCNTVISRGTLKNTIIEDDVKLDDLIHVAHNIRIGKRTMIASGVTLGGSCDIGQDVWIGSGAVIKNKTKIGDGAFIGIGAVVIKDVPPGKVMVGNPAKILRDRTPED